MLNIDIVTKDNNRIAVGRSLPSESVQRGGLYPSRKYFKLMTAMDEIKESVPCEKVLITGNEYIISNRHYDLTSGYAIVAQMTPDYKIYPELRRSKGKEIGVIKDENGLGVLDRWPVLEDIQQKEEEVSEIIKETQEQKFSDEAIHFDVSNESFSEYDFESNEEEKEL